MDIPNERIRDLRVGMLHMEQAEFSEKTGIPLERLKKIEKGTVKVRLADVTSVSDAFNISTEFFIGTRRFPSPVIRNEKEARIWVMIEQLSDEQLDELLECMKEELDIPSGEDE